MEQPGRMAPPLPGVFLLGDLEAKFPTGRNAEEHTEAHIFGLRGGFEELTLLGLNWGIILVIPYTLRTLPLALVATHAEHTNLKEILQLVFKILILL